MGVGGEWRGDLLGRGIPFTQGSFDSGEEGVGMSGIGGGGEFHSSAF